MATRIAIPPVARAAGLAVATVALWWAWLGWDTGYDTDPATGVTSGPYQVWQVAGCVLSIAVVAAVAGALLRPWFVVPVMAVTFTVCWSVRAATGDDTGMWPVGAFLVLVGTAAGTAVVSTAAWLVTRRRTRR